MNRVLNRPMFRREALRRGVLKPVKARVGQYIQQGPMMQQGPVRAQGPYSMIPTEYQGPKGKSFFYDKKSGSYLTDYGKSKIGRGLKGFGSGLLGITALYEGARAGGVPDPLVNAAYYSELAGLPLSLAKGKTAKTVGRMLTSGSRLAAANPLAAIGIGGALTLGGGTKSYFDERKMVEDYAKANNIPVKKAMDIFNRDLAGIGGRSITDFRKSDIGKAILATSSSRNIVAGGLDKKPEGPPGSKSYEQRIAGEMRNYFDDSKTYGRYFQDVDQLVNNVREQEKRFNMNYDTESMSPDDMMQVDQQAAYDKQQLDLAQIELRNAVAVQKDIDPLRASNIAVAVTEGKLKPEEIDAASTNDEVYSKVDNKMNDPNHPETIKFAKTNEEIEKKITNGNTSEEAKKTVGDTVGADTTDPEVNDAKRLAANVDITQFFKDPRISQTDPNKVFLLKLAAGLLSGQTMKGGLAGVGEILGNALGPAIDAKILVKMKNDEAYRDWASQVLTYNAALYKARNDAVKMKLTPGSFAMPDGTFAEARRDKETAQVFISQNGQLIPVTEQEGQFFEQKSDATLFDNVKLIADGYLSDKLLSDSIKLMESNKGKTAIGASGIFVNLIDVAKNIPGELRDGFFGANTTFDITQGDLSDKEYKKLQKRTNDAVEGLEEGITEFLKSNPEASAVLAKLRVNARMLTYSLANSLKDKDRLTNRDLELIEQLTQTMTAGMTDEKIISQYKNLLQAVREKNNIRIGKLGISGYTQQDTTTILNSMGLGSYSPQYTIEKEFNIDSAQAALDELMGIK
jgi:hypothetical protein